MPIEQTVQSFEQVHGGDLQKSLGKPAVAAIQKNRGLVELLLEAWKLDVDDSQRAIDRSSAAIVTRLELPMG